MQITERPALKKIQQRRNQNIIGTMITVFGDESHDSKKQRAFAVAGVMGTQGQWDNLEIKWRKRLGDKLFHAADCESDRREFAGFPHEENQKLYRDLVDILADSFLDGYGVVMDLAAYRTYFPDGLANVQYIHCFRYVIEHYSQRTSLLIPKEPSVTFIFDQNTKIEYSASELFFIYREKADWPYNKYLDNIAFNSKRKSFGLQVADLYAREIMKDGDNYFKYQRGECNRFQRKSLRRLRDTHRFSIGYLAHGYWEDYKNRFAELDEQDGISREDYENWRDEKGLDDSLPSRIHYFAYINKLDNLQSQ